MIRRYSSVPTFLFHQLRGALRGDPRGGVSVIGGANGPTAVFVAKIPRPFRDHGRLSFEPDAAAIRRAAKASFALALFAAALAGAIYLTSGRKR